MTFRTAALLLFVSGLFVWAGAGAQEAGPSKTEHLLSAALEAQVKAMNAEDLNAMMALFHPGVPDSKEVRRSLAVMFRQLDLQYSLERQRLVAVDGRYAYLRCLQTLRGDPRGVSRSDQLFVFRRYGEGWRLWTSLLLEQVPLPVKGPGGR